MNNQCTRALHWTVVCTSIELLIPTTACYLIQQMSLCFNRWNFVWFFVWLVYCIDVAASFPGSCNINNWKAGGGGWEQGYLCGFVWGQSWVDETTRRMARTTSFAGWELSWQSAIHMQNFDLMAKRYWRVQLTLCFLAVIRRSRMRSAVVLTMRWVAKLYLLCWTVESRVHMPCV